MPNPRSRGGQRPQRVLPRPNRVRSLVGTSFGWLATDLLRRGWLRELPAEATAVYAFLCLAADREGLSYYRRARIGEELGLDEQQVRRALERLSALDLVAYAPFRAGAPDGFHQVLSLPGGAPTAPEDDLLRGLTDRLAERFRGDPGGPGAS